MPAIDFILEKLRHGGNLSSAERKQLIDGVDRITAKLSGCAQEVARRDEAAGVARQQDLGRADRLRLSEEEVARLQDALAHARRQRQTENDDHEDKVRILEGVLKDIHYGLLYQPELNREQLAEAIAGTVEPWPTAPGGKPE